ncbi:hypothetical protein BH10PSE12_BH10PSE12_36820 [soil metagenome]
MSDDRVSGQGFGTQHRHDAGAQDAAALPVAPHPTIRLVSVKDAAAGDPPAERAPFVDRPPRFLLVEPAQLQVDGQTIAVQVIDISPGGVKLLALNGGLLGQPGRSGLLSVLGMQAPIAGSIRWCVDGRMGFNFDAELTTHIIECIRANPSLQARRAYLNGRLNSI